MPREEFTEHSVSHNSMNAGMVFRYDDSVWPILMKQVAVQSIPAKCMLLATSNIIINASTTFFIIMS